VARVTGQAGEHHPGDARHTLKKPGHLPSQDARRCERETQEWHWQGPMWCVHV
jgi:hypothetical protein